MGVRRRTTASTTPLGRSRRSDESRPSSRATSTTSKRTRSDRFDGERAGRSSSDDLVRLRGTAGTTARPLMLRLRDEVKLDVAEASGVADLGGGLLAVIDDEKGVYLASHDGAARCAASSKDDPRLKDLEGLCRAPDGKAVLVVAEGTGEVLRLPITGRGDKRALGEAESLGRLPMLNDANLNKGWEGIDVMPGRFFDDGCDRLLAVNEGEPRRVGLFTLPDLDDAQLLKLPEQAKDHADDLSDVAVDPKTGHILLLSDQSEAVLELQLVQRRTLAPGALLGSLALELLKVTPLDVKKGAKPEGLDVTPEGDLLLCTDEKARLYRFNIER